MKKLLAFLIVPLPSFLKVLVLRHLLGHQVEHGVHIGMSFINVQSCRLGRNTRIGHFNYIASVEDLDIGADCVIGHFNILLGGRRVALGDGATIGRFNEINSILNPLVRGRPDPVLEIGRRAVITAGHKIDFTDKVTIGESAIVAGRLSNIWTHNRQDVAPVSIGAHCYVGSGIQMVPGSAVGAACVIGLGAVITRPFTNLEVLIAGVPAIVVKPLDESTLPLVRFPTRPDLDGMPDDSATRCGALR